MKQVILFFALAGSAFGQYTIGMSTATNALGLQAATPTFSPAAGTYTSTQTVTISTATPLAVLCYTTDGSTPTETANLCSGGTTSTYSTPITVSTTQTVKAIATLATYTDSAVGTALYTISAGTILPVGSGFTCTSSASSANTLVCTYSPTAGNAVAIKLAFPSTTTYATGASDNGSSGGSSWTCQTAEVGAARSAQICGTLSAASSVTTITIAISGASQPRTGIGQEYSGVVHFGNATGGTFTSTASVHGTSTLTYSGDYAVMAVASAVSTTSMAVHTPSSNCAHTSCGTIPSTNVQVYATQITVTDEYNTYAGTGSIDIWGTLSYSGGSGAWATLELENQ